MLTIDLRSVATIYLLLSSKSMLIIFIDRIVCLSRLSLHVRHVLKKVDLLNDLESYAKTHGYSLNETTSRINARKKHVNCTLLNSLGMVVPVENDVGYRSVPMTKGTRENTFNYCSM
jgi:hypothetical protein